MGYRPGRVWGIFCSTAFTAAFLHCNLCFLFLEKIDNGKNLGFIAHITEVVSSNAPFNTSSFLVYFLIPDTAPTG